jgi:hypothetical protein
MPAFEHHRGSLLSSSVANWELGNTSVTVDPFMTPDDVARIIKRPVSWLAKKRMTGDGPPFLKIGGKIRYRRSGLEAWLTGCERTSTAQPHQANDTASASAAKREPLGSPLIVPSPQAGRSRAERDVSVAPGRAKSGGGQRHAGTVNAARLRRP